MKPGWIKVFRKITDCDWYSQKPFDKTHAFLDLLLMAAWEETVVIRRGRKITLRPGELAISVRELSERWGMNRRTAMRLLFDLESVKTITQRKNNATTVISIINWESYQSGCTTECTTGCTTECTTECTTAGGIIGGKEEKKKEESESESAESPLWIEAEKIRARFPRIGNFNEDCAAIVSAIRRESEKPGGTMDAALEQIRESVNNYAEAVKTWPLPKRRYIASCRNWFEAGRYHESPDMWDQSEAERKATGKRFNVLDESTWS